MILPSLYFGLRQLTHKSAERSYHRMRGAIVGVGLALIPMVVVMQVAGGLIRGITERYIEVGSFHLQARAYAAVDAEELKQKIETAGGVPGVSGVYEVRNGMGLLHGEDSRTGVSVQALPMNLAEEDRGFRDYLEVSEGELVLNREDAIMVSEPIAGRLGVGVGDEVRLLTARSTSTGRYILRQTALQVAGVFTTGYHDLDEMTVLISAERGARLFHEEEALILAIKVDEPFGELDTIKTELQGILGRNWFVFTWQQLEEAMYSTFQTQKNLLLLIMGVIVIVAGVNISGSLIMLVMEKEQDIAILVSSGVKKRVVVLSFLSLGTATGIVGTALGMGVGILISVHINEVISGIEAVLSWMRYGILLLFQPRNGLEYSPLELMSSSFYLDRIPTVLNPFELISVGALSLAVSVVASIAPVRRLARLLPVEVLRRH